MNVPKQTIIAFNKLLKFTAQMAKGHNAIEIGHELVELGCDELVSGGFWVLDLGTTVEYYSPKFRSSLGYESEDDFPNHTDSWKNAIDENDLMVAVDNFNKHIGSDGVSPYYQEVTYNKKDGGQLRVLCSGCLIKDDAGQKSVLIGTHNIIDP